MRPQDRRALRTALALGLSLFVASCRSGALEKVSSALRFEVPSDSSTTRAATVTLTFDQVYADAADHAQPVNVINDGPVWLSVTWTGLAAPFSAQLPNELPPGATSVSLHFVPQVAGAFAAQLQVSSPGVDSALLGLQARALAIPTCTPSAACRRASFDLSQGRCVEEVEADGASCAPGTKCVEQATCQSGRCVGTPLVCDDGDACTVDVCQAELGCEHLPAPPCPGDGVCQVGVCDSKSGCALAPATDGTRCGGSQSCVLAQVCIEGECRSQHPPDGYVCDEASPCRDEGRCAGDQCVHVSAGPSTLAPTWSFDSATTQADGGTQQYQDFVLEPSGELSIGGFFNSPGILRANTTKVNAEEGGARRCILWNGHLVCADYPATPNGRVSAIDLGTGATAWTFDIHLARPDFVLLTSQIFLARLVAQGSDRLAALFEAYPAAPAVPGSAQCRSYFLAVIDASGKLVMAQRVLDPMFDACNHPHPYGLASDSVGNLYIAFSPTHSPQAPLVPDRPTMIISYTHDGLFRWKRTEETIQGGELAVARGLLYPENSAVVLDAPTGAPSYAIPSALGRAVISAARLIPSPAAGGTSLAGFEAGQTSLRWIHPLPQGWAFWGEQLRLAAWSTSQGPRTVALTFATDERGQKQLHAVDVANGLEAFSCPMSLPQRTEPQLFEVANGHLAVMEGALDSQGNPACLKCDPPLAFSSAAFQVVDTPGLSVVSEPWVGTFGGAGHDHHED